MIVKEITDYLKEKTHSTAIVSLIFFYVLCNCRWIFASLFTDQALVFEKYGLLKNEYIFQYFIELHPDSIMFWICSIFAPIILTIIYIWCVPRVFINPAYKRQLLYQNERRIFKIEEEKKIANIENSVADAKIELEEKKNILSEKNPGIVLDEEYSSFQSNRNWIIALNELKRIMYEQHGVIEDDSNADLLMMLDVNGLIEPMGVMDESINITEKGKWFLRKASEEQLL